MKIKSKFINLVTGEESDLHNGLLLNELEEDVNDIVSILNTPNIMVILQEMVDKVTKNKLGRKYNIKDITIRRNIDNKPVVSGDGICYDWWFVSSVFSCKTLHMDVVLTLDEIYNYINLVYGEGYTINNPPF